VGRRGFGGGADCGTDGGSLLARAGVGDAARLCSERAHHPARAVALYEAAIQDDRRSRVLSRPSKPSWCARASTRTRLGLPAPDRALTAAGVLDQQPELLRKLARVQRDHLDASETAIQTLDRLIQLAPVDLDARLEIATLLEKVGEPTLAMRALEVAAVLEPARSEVYARWCGSSGTRATRIGSTVPARRWWRWAKPTWTSSSVSRSSGRKRYPRCAARWTRMPGRSSCPTITRSRWTSWRRLSSPQPWPR